MSKVFSIVLRELFVDGPLADIGLVLEHASGRTRRFFAKLGYFIQDGAAHKQTWHRKGESGCKLCVLRRNVFSYASEVVDEEGDELLRCCTKTYAELDLASSEDLRWSVRRLNTLRDDPDIDPNEFAIREKPWALPGRLTICLQTPIWIQSWMRLISSSTVGCIWCLLAECST